MDLFLKISGEEWKQIQQKNELLKNTSKRWKKISMQGSLFTKEKTFIIDLHQQDLLIHFLVKVTTVGGNFCVYFLTFNCGKIQHNIKFTILPIVSIQFGSIAHIHALELPRPLPISRTFHLSEPKLCTH